MLNPLFLLLIQTEYAILHLFYDSCHPSTGTNIHNLYLRAKTNMRREGSGFGSDPQADTLDDRN